MFLKFNYIMGQPINYNCKFNYTMRQPINYNCMFIVLLCKCVLYKKFALAVFFSDEVGAEVKIVVAEGPVNVGGGLDPERVNRHQDAGTREKEDDRVPLRERDPDRQNVPVKTEAGHLMSEGLYPGKSCMCSEYRGGKMKSLCYVLYLHPVYTITLSTWLDGLINLNGFAPKIGKYY